MRPETRQTLPRALTVTRSFYFCSFTRLIVLAWVGGWGAFGVGCLRWRIGLRKKNICFCLFLQLFVSCVKLTLMAVTSHFQKSFYSVFRLSRILWKVFQTALRKPCEGFVFGHETSMTKDFLLAVNKLDMTGKCWQTLSLAVSVSLTTA